MEVVDGNSRLGFNGNVPIQPGLQAVWQIEGGLNNFELGGVNNQGSSATFDSRNTFVGVDSTTYGRVLLGYIDSPYRSLVGSGSELGGNLGLKSYGLDLWNNTSAQMAGNPYSILGRGEARYKSSINYLSPTLAGLQVGAAYSFDEQQVSGANRAAYSVAAKYQHDAFQIGIAYAMQKDTGVDQTLMDSGEGFGLDSETDANTHHIEMVASYRFPTHTYVGIGVERSSYGASTFTLPTSGQIYTGLSNGSMNQTGTMISIAQEVTPTITAMLSYGRLGALSNVSYGTPDDYKAQQISVGGIDRLNKHFSAYVYYTKIKNNALQNVNLGQSPLYSNNAGSSDAFLSPGDSPRAIGVGLIAYF